MPTRHDSRRIRRRGPPPGGHRSVMLSEVVAVLQPAPGELVVDCTLGLAGHAVALLERVGPSGRLIGIDCDSENLTAAQQALEATHCPFSVQQSNFAALPRILGEQNTAGADVLIADLGFSSTQVDDPARGFSYARNGPLDMRMNRSRGRTAADILATISQADLEKALHELGDEPNAAQIAQAIVHARQIKRLECTFELNQVICDVVGKPVTRGAGWRVHPRPGKWQSHPAARTFQTLRLLVNRELENLQELLRVLPECLQPGGRVAIISFHSGEDRLVKTAFRQGLQRGDYSEIALEPIRPSAHERMANARSRSAKMRWAWRKEDGSRQSAVGKTKELSERCESIWPRGTERHGVRSL